MSDETDPPVPAALPAQDDPTAPENPPQADGSQSVTFRSPLTPGQRWRDYQIGDKIETDTGWCYRAVNVGMLEDIEIRALPINDQTEMRSQAWAELQSLYQPGLVKVGDAFDADGYRFEISQPPPPTTLREWLPSRQATLDDVQSLVQQISDVLIPLHDRGLVHLNLSPDTIYVLSEGQGLRVVVGGLEHTTIYNQPGLIPVPVDPYYAPPEAAGLSKHSPGAGLRAWDWWSLGRIVQEVILGKHVLSIVLNRDVSTATPELRVRAENLLLERDPQAPRAGAVELMPSMSQRLTDLLRGLLTSVRTGRWGTDEILRWLKQLPVKDRYQLNRNQELFAWKDRTFTIEEAAEYFSREENWIAGVANLFDTDDSMTLVSFVGERPEYSKVRAQIDELHKFIQIPNWKNLPSEASQAAVASAAWLLLGGEDAKLTLYGQRVDAACIKSLFARGGVAEGVFMVKALTVRPYIQMIEQADPEAAHLLTILAGTMSGEAVTKALMDGWLSLENAADFARLLLLAMEPEQKLIELRTGLQQRFACSREAQIQQLLTQANLSHPELVLLASTAAQPERYSYVTHADWNRERFEDLKQRGTRLAAGLFWLRVGQAHRAGYLLFGPWKIVLGIWIGVAVAAGWTAGYARLPLWLLGAVAGGAALRYAGGRWLTFLLRKKAPQSRPWIFLTPLSRSNEEALVALGGEAIAPTASAISGELAVIQAEVAGLALKPVPPPLPQPGLVLPAWIGPLAGWSFVVLLLLAGYWKPHGGPMPDLDPKSAAALAIENAMKAAPADAKLTPEEYFYGDPRKPPARWNIAKPASAPAVAIARVKPATPDDVALALIEGQRLLLPYQQKSVDALIAVPVNGNNGAGLILYDGRNRRVVGRELLLPAQLPAEKSWFEVDRLKIFYVGEPPPPPPALPKLVVDPQKPFDTSDLPEREVRRGAYQDVTHGAEQKTTNAQPLSDALDKMPP
jgi:serine/threonine protein kinase